MFDSAPTSTAIDVVRRATRLVQHIQKKMVNPALTKGDRSPVTVADFAAQALVSKLLADALPDEQLVGEEDAAELRSEASRDALRSVASFVSEALSEEATPDDVCQWIDRAGGQPGDSFWTLDPIDGTKGFLRGEQYAVALAKIERGQVVLGVLGCPNLADGYRIDIDGPGSLILAVAGQGTWTAPLDEGSFQRLHVSTVGDPREARILRSVEAGHTNVGQVGEVVQALGTEAEPVLMDSQAKYAVLAAGQAEMLFRLISASRPDYREKTWDQAAGSLVVTEAGGRITDLDGRDLDFTQGRTLARNRGVLATNGLLHEAALAALRQVAA